MSQVSVSLEKGFLKYYNTVTRLGNIDKKVVDNLIVASWINDAIKGKYDCVLTEEQYVLLSNLYTCVEGSCLVPYREYEKCCSSTTASIQMYYGSGRNYTDFFNNKEEQDLPAKSAAGSYNVSVRHDVDYVYFLIPSSMNINSASMGGFGFPLESPVDVTVDDTDYKYYKSANTYDAGTITIVIS